MAVITSVTIKGITYPPYEIPEDVLKELQEFMAEKLLDLEDG